MKKLEVNRSTFYLHYESIDDLLDEALKHTVDKLIIHFDKTPKEFIEKLNTSSKEELILINEEYLKPYLEFIKNNKKIFMAAFRNPKVMKATDAYLDLEKYIFDPILEKYNVPNYKRKYMLKFYINGIMAIVKEWAINNCEDSIDSVVDIIVECVRP